MTFTESVKEAQEHYGSRAHHERLQTNFGPNDQLGPREADFIAQRDTFYLATVSETGWPYVQNRGGPPGFLKVLGPNQLAYADIRGNTQLIIVGNVLNNNHCSLILMDYPNRRRLKVLGHMRVADARNLSPEILEQVEHPDYRARVEGVVTIDIDAFDWNCPQHITRRYTESEFKDYYNHGRVHQGLDGAPPNEKGGVAARAIARLDDYRWEKRCRGLYQLPAAA